MQALKRFLSSLLPRGFYRAILKPYHYAWALGSAIWYGFPAKKLIVIGVTGTKGKSSVSEMLTAILTEAGYQTAVAGTIRFAWGAESEPNLFKMTMPGRGFIQKFLAKAVASGCTHAVLEITSEATLNYRHLFLEQNALIFTNLQKEHLEAHGSFANYFRAKLRIAEELVHSSKRPRAIIANASSVGADAFLATPVEERIPFSLADASEVEKQDGSVAFTYKGARFELAHPGDFSILNALAATKTAEFLGVPLATAARALRALARIPGRAERIERGQSFAAVVDYAHTPDSLKALYDAYAPREDSGLKHKLICVLGNTGGGRDTWKRPEMGKIASEACEQVFLTDEDPYDEDPRAIVEAMAEGMERKPTIIMDRREAIAAALRAAGPGDAVLITGKGTDPFIMGPRGTKTPWSDSRVVAEELEKLLAQQRA
jgi:UDP-N-acetylmuramoyl-L-alanyl-D-glutamate--2,6-diaminopimelate ligase